MAEEMPEEKKILIDEDWKTQVQAEKEAFQQEEGDSSKGADADHADHPMPPASFEFLLTSLATEAMMALGQIPHPGTGQLQAHPQQAKYLIDTIDVLREKTKGNLTPEEERILEDLLHQLRMVFVAVSTGGGEAGEAAGGDAAAR